MSRLDADKVSILKQKVYKTIGCCITVHKILGPYLNEYMYQDALAIELNAQHIVYQKEHYFTATYRGQVINHKHYVDFMVHDEGEDILVECKAIEEIGDSQRQQLWNYMRLTNTSIGILYNFAPSKDQCEKYYYDQENQQIYAF